MFLTSLSIDSALEAPRALLVGSAETARFKGVFPLAGFGFVSSLASLELSFTFAASFTLSSSFFGSSFSSFSCSFSSFSSFLGSFLSKSSSFFKALSVSSSSVFLEGRSVVGLSLPRLLQIGRAVQQECRDRSRMPSSA
eukprot:TRINITY_DN26658_c0_g1_i1.p1 TRINITY_DN26658_c0_g1~~TRINITY_DN26658_c0_g1_i1.p1  ORF type:complete len:139 (-),score=0.39 TRINITY_DN26658_c0_g1_i1:10-426(-)